MPLIECVPNFSEGRDKATLDAISAAICAVEGVTLLDVDPGAATNRTVFTFVGEPEPVKLAALAAAAAAADRIDMQQHSGEHPRFGAMDVCPLIPIADISMEEAVEHARDLGRRLGEQGRTIFLYEQAATREDRRNLAVVRAGEYEGLQAKLAGPDGAPDFGPTELDPRWGATAVGARDFLIAYNVNLNTTSSRRANAVAFDVREKGRIRREPDPLTGEIVRDSGGEPTWTPGSLKCVKGIGWFIEEYGICQVSMNLTNLAVTPLHVAFDECSARSQARGLRVTGSEVVGLVPLEAMLAAGRFFLRKQQRSLGVSDSELIKIAVRSMGLDELTPFEPGEKIIEYAIRKAGARRLVDLSLGDLVEETASESPAPGGGSVAAAVGALGAALATMVANLSSHKRGWDDRWETFSDHAEAGKACHTELQSLVDQDTDAFNGIVAAWRSDEEGRAERVQAATRRAIEVPLRVMEVSVESLAICQAMATDGLPASLSDAGVGALCARTAALGADLNVRINAKDLTEEATRASYLARADELRKAALEGEAAVLAQVNSALET